MENDNELIANFMKKISSNGERKSSTQYQYSYVDLEIVMSNPNEYIIPQCLPACMILWDKNIETFMVSNNEDENLYVLLFNLSEENESFLESQIQIDSRFIFSDYRNTYGIMVKGKDATASEELASLASMLHLQDTKRFTTPESYLKEFKTKDGGFRIDEYGHIIKLENPKLADTTLEEALRQDGKENLYVASENRIYDSAMYLKWHQKYLQALAKHSNQIGVKTQQDTDLDKIRPKF